jgi:hypothetical protein
MLAVHLHRLPGAVVGHRRGGREGPAVDALTEPGRGQLPQVTPDAVLRDPEFGGDVLGHQPAVAGQPVQQELLALRSQHARFSTFFFVFAESIASLAA